MSDSKRQHNRERKLITLLAQAARAVTKQEIDEAKIALTALPNDWMESEILTAVRSVIVILDRKQQSIEGGAV